MTRVAPRPYKKALFRSFRHHLPPSLRPLTLPSRSLSPTTPNHLSSPLPPLTLYLATMATAPKSTASEKPKSTEKPKPAAADKPKSKKTTERKTATKATKPAGIKKPKIAAAPKQPKPVEEGKAHPTWKEMIKVRSALQL